MRKKRKTKVGYVMWRSHQVPFQPHEDRFPKLLTKICTRSLPLSFATINLEEWVSLHIFSKNKIWTLNSYDSKGPELSLSFSVVAAIVIYCCQYDFLQKRVMGFFSSCLLPTCVLWMWSSTWGYSLCIYIYKKNGKSWENTCMVS